MFFERILLQMVSYSYRLELLDLNQVFQLIINICFSMFHNYFEPGHYQGEFCLLFQLFLLHSSLLLTHGTVSMTVIRKVWKNFIFTSLEPVVYFSSKRLCSSLPHSLTFTVFCEILSSTQLACCQVSRHDLTRYF